MRFIKNLKIPSTQERLKSILNQTIECLIQKLEQDEPDYSNVVPYDPPTASSERILITTDPLKKISHFLQNIPMFRAAKEVRIIWNKILKLLIRKQVQRN